MGVGHAGELPGWSILNMTRHDQMNSGGLGALDFDPHADEVE
jgi:hypothetical protein